MVATSTPMSIPASEPNAINNTSRGDNSGPQYSPRSISSDDEEGRCGASALSAALRNSDSLGDLAVGSLPTHLRRPFKCGMMRREGIPNNGSRQFVGPVSLPQPRAPFLSSREGPKDKLSSMPEVTLPASVVSANPKLFSSVQYGSLRESRFPRDQCDQFRLEKSNDAEVIADSFLPSSFSAYPQDGHIEAHFNPNRSSSNSSLGGSVIGLLSQKSGGKSQLIVDDVEGIAEGCNGIALNEGAGPLCNGPMQRHVVSSIVGNQVDNEESHETRVDPLSNSLTALEVLTQIRKLPMTHNEMVNIELSKKATPVGNNILQRNRSQQLHTRFTPPQYSVAGMLSHDNDDHHANPDTFEAFDFELDG